MRRAARTRSEGIVTELPRLSACLRRRWSRGKRLIVFALIEPVECIGGQLPRTQQRLVCHGTRMGQFFRPGSSVGMASFAAVSL